MTWVQNLAGAALAVLAAGSTALAQVRSGSVLNFSGSALATDLGRPGVSLAFTDGQVVADTSGNTRAFAEFNRGGRPSSPVGVIANFTVGAGEQRIPEFLTIGGYTFSLAGLPSGAFGQSACYLGPDDPAPDVGQTCTPYQSDIGNPRPGIDGLSPFYLTNRPGSDFGLDVDVASVVAFNLAGTVVRTVGGAVEPGAAFFGTIYSVLDLPYQYVLAGLEGASGPGGQGLIVPFYGSFIVGGRASSLTAMAELDPQDVQATVTPEPGTVLLLGAGLAGVAALARRRRAA
jgi:hypothetical protein